MVWYFYRFLVFCSGTDADILKECPKSEKVKFSAIGATIFFTGLFACFSGGYALHTIFDNLAFSTLFSLLFGLIWGCVIFNLDRYLVSSLKKEGKVRRELLFAAPRFFMAIIIALVISRPLEVRIFQDRISEQIHQNEINHALIDKEKIDTLYNQSTLANQLKGKEEQIRDWQAKKDKGDPEKPEFQALLLDASGAKSALQSVIYINTPKINQFNEKIGLIKKQSTFYDEYNHSQLPEEAISEINEIRRKRNILENEINNKQRKSNELETLIKEERQNYRSELTNRMAVADLEKNSLAYKKDVADSAAKIVYTEGSNSRSISFSNNFITRMEAMGDLTSQRFSTLWWTSSLIFLLIMLIEISPILVKVLSDRGPYDEKIETRDKKIAQYESAERTLNDAIANGIYLTDSILLKKVEHYGATAKKSTETLLAFVKSSVEQNENFDELMIRMNEQISRLENVDQQEKHKKNQNNVIEMYDNFRQKVYSLFKKVLGIDDSIPD